MNVIEILKTRYSTKEFKAGKNLTEEQIGQLEDLLQLAPSSTNVQPWHFILATTEEGKKRVAKSTENFVFNQKKILDASAVVVFATKTDITEDYLQYLQSIDEKAGRFPTKELKEQSYAGRKKFADIHKYDLKDSYAWADKQVFLNLGNFLLGVAALGLDAVTMEGVDMKVLDEEFNLHDKGFTATVVVSVGYHSEGDYNKNLPKARLSKNEIIERV